MAEHDEPTEAHEALSPQMLVPLTRRSHAQPERPAVPPEVAEQFQQLMQSVQVLSAHFLPEPEPPPVETVKDRSVRRIKKFQRAGVEERIAAPTSDEDAGLESPAEGEQPATEPDETADPLARNKSIAWPRQSPFGEGDTPGDPLLRWWRRRPSLGVMLGAQALGLLLLAVGYLLGHYFSRSSEGSSRRPGRTAGDLFGQPGLSEQALQVANEGLRAEHAGDVDGARKIYETALSKHVELAGINYRLALLAVQRNDRLEAEQRLERSTLDGESVADCCYVLARLAADKGDYEEMGHQFQRATHAQPFVGKYFFYQGEATRRQGQPQAAATAFEQALDRPYTAESGDLYLFKARLAKVEYGHDDAFNAELASHLKQTPVAGEWMLLAAAQELDHQAYADAAEHLRLAADRLPSTVYSAYTHDYFFQGFAKRSEVMSLLNRMPPLVISSAGPTVLDPGSWSPQRADPAIWPSAADRNQPTQ